jgi:hypothetical protein
MRSHTARLQRLPREREALLLVPPPEREEELELLRERGFASPSLERLRERLTPPREREPCVLLPAMISPS